MKYFITNRPEEYDYLKSNTFKLASLNEFKNWTRDKDVFQLDTETLFVDDNALAAYFDTDINEAFIKELATREPLRVVFRDAGFSSDSVKINIEQIFKLLSPCTEIKVI